MVTATPIPSFIFLSGHFMDAPDLLLVKLDLGSILLVIKAKPLDFVLAKPGADREKNEPIKVSPGVESLHWLAVDPSHANKRIRRSQEPFHFRIAEDCRARVIFRREEDMNLVLNQLVSDSERNGCGEVFQIAPGHGRSVL